MSRTNTDWRAMKQWRDRPRYRRAGAIREQAAGGAQATDVKVYGPDGALREVVSAAEWRRRHGDPFKQPRRREEEEDGETQRTAEPGEGQEDAP